MTTDRKNFGKIMKRLKRDGWKVTVTGGGHYKLVSPDKAVPPIFTSRTAGDVRALRNLKAILRRAGVDI